MDLLDFADMIVVADIVTDDIHNQSKGGKKMATLKEDAKAFEPKKKLNIADLPSVSVDAEIHTDGEGINKENEPYTYCYLLFNEDEYYVPDTVRMQLKEILELKPDLKTFKVEKSGAGLNTKYKVKFLT